MKRVGVELDHRWAYIDTDTDTYKQLQDFWSFSVPGARFMPKVQDGVWDGRIRFLSRRKVRAGLFRATYLEAAETLDLVFDIKEHLNQEEFAEAPDVIDPKYDHQRRCVSAMCKAIPHGGGIVLAATSAGKTRIAAMLMYRMPERRFLFMVDQKNLLYQAQKELATALDTTVGVVGDSRFDPARLTCATVQTLKKHIGRPAFDEWLNTIDVVLVDEIHEQLSKGNLEVIDNIAPLAIFGLTATLEIKKKPVRYKAFALAGPVIFRFSIEEGMKKGVLQKGSVIQLVFDKVAEYRTSSAAEEYDMEVIENEQKHKAAYWLTHLLVDYHKRHVVQLVDRLEHLRRMGLQMHDVDYATMFGGVSKLQREESIDAFEDGVIKLMIANQVMKKGVSIKIIDAIIDMAERKSANDAIQKFGRGVRQHENQTPLLHIDFATARSNDPHYERDELSRAGKARARAFRAEHIPFYRVRVHSAKDALKAVSKLLKMQKEMVHGD